MRVVGPPTGPQDVRQGQVALKIQAWKALIAC